MTKHTILFLAANPTGNSPLALDREARAIHVELERSGYRDEFEFVTRSTVEPLVLLRELRPTVVHCTLWQYLRSIERCDARGLARGREIGYPDDGHSWESAW